MDPEDDDFLPDTMYTPISKPQAQTKFLPPVKPKKPAKELPPKPFFKLAENKYLKKVRMYCCKS